VGDEANVILHENLLERQAGFGKIIGMFTHVDDSADQGQQYQRINKS
jgi:hypothetical protein